MCTKNYQNRAWFDKVIEKNKMVQFFDSQCSSMGSFIDVVQLHVFKHHVCLCL